MFHRPIYLTQIINKYKLGLETFDTTNKKVEKNMAY